MQYVQILHILRMNEYEKYRVAQDREYVSDFDRAVKKLLDSEKGRKGKSK